LPAEPDVVHALRAAAGGAGSGGGARRFGRRRAELGRCRVQGGARRVGWRPEPGAVEPEVAHTDGGGGQSRASPVGAGTP